MVCIVGGRHELFPLSDAELRNVTPADLQALAVQMLKDWPEQARQFVAVGESESFFVVGMYTSVPGVLDSPTNVTLLASVITSKPAIRDHLKTGQRD